jgi:hypothetical protein
MLVEQLNRDSIFVLQAVLDFCMFDLGKRLAMRLTGDARVSRQVAVVAAAE